ncbi:MAG: sugar ABC transporter ATP-binding protein [Ilumatobacteraceae bacterium]
MMTATTGTTSEPTTGVPAVDASGRPALSLHNICKHFGPVRANDDITVDVRAGEIHALLGENGSGKSTLLSIASGSLAPETGTVAIDGEVLHSASPRAAMHLGLGMAYQHLTSVHGLTVAESLFLATPDQLRPKYSQMYDWAAARLAEYGLEIRGATRIETLSAAHLQLLEIVSALLSQPKVLLLDEPTTALGHADVQRLHSLIRDLAARGMAVVYVSHRLPEVLDVADRVTVLRDGVSQGTYDAAGMSEADVVAMMIGRPLEHAFPQIEDVEHGSVVLETAKLRGRRFGPVDLQLRSGEIVGIAGAEGNGQVQFLRALAGVETSHGQVHCAGKRVHLTSPPDAIRAGIILLSADRKQESIFTALSVRANATLQVLRRYARLGFVFRAREKPAVNGMVERLRLKAASIEQPTQYLSGGNQQKVALMRPFLRPDLKVILADEPTQGVDVGARLDIYHALRDKAAEGTAVLVKSSDAIELAGICDRVIVMSRGIVVDEILRDELDERRIIAAIIGRGSAHGGQYGE